MQAVLHLLYNFAENLAEGDLCPFSANFMSAVNVRIYMVQVGIVMACK